VRLSACNNLLIGTCMSMAGDGSVPATLGRRIADCREQRGWKQKTLAEEAGISVTFLSEVENDRRMPGTEALLKLADALESTLDYLVKGTLDTTPSRRALTIPRELEELAEESQLSFSDTSRLMKYAGMVVARRNGATTADGPEKKLSKDEWRSLLEWMNKSPL
jgi:transcriptional regulator with XRE-family HTH domain